MLLRCEPWLAVTAPEVLEPIMRDLDALNSGAEGRRRVGVRRGLHPAEHGHRGAREATGRTGHSTSHRPTEQQEPYARSTHHLFTSSDEQIDSADSSIQARGLRTGFAHPTGFDHQHGNRFAV
jgi:hypothetical protein